MGAWFWWMIFGMAVVTYIPRAIPLTFLEGRELPEAVQSVLRNIPYAVLGALIFPAVFFIQENVWFGVIGAASAFAIAFTGANVILVVLGTIAILSVYGLWFG
ncbi:MULTISPECIES: AzlD domain-containing protein [unclassified Planococcus (in: firmicutes)]|uniref:AzlD domain-containing protein n=1 Tax=unclassified Planococcus (in: firmicutes) TaxID=2662419 RepID=UPI000C349AAB|nr:MULTISPECIES: AzlD domain-containing protein [unclassified Planococcus (in: firmicutes)]AUD14285.1 branched-chain amino acid transporter [Planococcus sp. MB-3u-03]PKG48327.1 branched-chain amino acid transporter [Planococcus sp. Urea-trap-24]PKG92174.1 branched-chain amino acid transporter [Planococcus sp. Urea-3u-39]PKH42920.1 branched-chain amino acid transporter [Planococcus sp. MB-3u-09]